MTGQGAVKARTGACITVGVTDGEGASLEITMDASDRKQGCVREGRGLLPDLVYGAGGEDAAAVAHTLVRMRCGDRSSI